VPPFLQDFLKCQIVFASFSEKPSQTKQTYKTISFSFSLGVSAWRDGVLSEQCQTNNDVNDVNEAATSFG